MWKTMHYSADDSYRHFIPSTTLFSYPSVMKDVARLADIWGNLDQYNYSKSEEEADRHAIARDYMLVMGNIANAQQDYEQQKGHK